MTPNGSMPINPARKRSSTTVASDGTHVTWRNRSAMKQATVAAMNSNESSARMTLAAWLTCSDFENEWKSPRPVRHRPASVPLVESTRIRIWIRCSVSWSCADSVIERSFLGLDQSLDEPFLHQDHDQRGRQHRKHRGGHHEMPLHGSVAAESHTLDADHGRIHLLLGSDEQRPQVLIPPVDEQNHEQSGDVGARERDDDIAQEAQWTGAVDARRFRQFLGNREEELAEEECRRRRGDQRHGESGI